jgi:hypothetical protein
MAEPERKQMSWREVDYDILMDALDAVCNEDGVVSLMFGGYGRYYKVSTRIGGTNNAVTAEDATHFTAKLYTHVLQRGR